MSRWPRRRTSLSFRSQARALLRTLRVIRAPKTIGGGPLIRAPPPKRAADAVGPRHPSLNGLTLTFDVKTLTSDARERRASGLASPVVARSTNHVQNAQRRRVARVFEARLSRALVLGQEQSESPPLAWHVPRGNRRRGATTVLSSAAGPAGGLSCRRRIVAVLGLAVWRALGGGELRPWSASRFGGRSPCWPPRPFSGLGRVWMAVVCLGLQVGHELCPSCAF